MSANDEREVEDLTLHEAPPSEKPNGAHLAAGGSSFSVMSYLKPRDSQSDGETAEEGGSSRMSGLLVRLLGFIVVAPALAMGFLMMLGNIAPKDISEAYEKRDLNLIWSKASVPAGSIPDFVEGVDQPDPLPIKDVLPYALKGERPISDGGEEQEDAPVDLPLSTAGR